MIESESVLFPEPFGPMSAWTSPLRTTRSIPLRISFPSTLTCRSLISSVATMCVLPWAPLRRDGGLRLRLVLGLSGELGERHAVERIGDGRLQLQPHHPRAAVRLTDAVQDRIALRGADLRLDRALQRAHDVAGGDVLRIAREGVPAAGPALSGHQARAAERRDELLEIRLRQLLTFRHRVQRYAPAAVVAREIDHQSHAVLAAGRNVERGRGRRISEHPGRNSSAPPVRRPAGVWATERRGLPSPGPAPARRPE